MSSRIVLISSFLMLAASLCFANDDIYIEAKRLQQKGDFDEAIRGYREYLIQPFEEDRLDDHQLSIYTDALVQFMNSYQSKGEPETCVTAMQELFEISPILQNQCLRDFYSVMGYALSRTEDMDKAEEIMLRALALPLHNATHERYFRDYAYAAAVFYSNPDYQKEVVNWCNEALEQAKSSNNTSGQQWVKSMLGSLYKRNGDLSAAMDLFQQSIEESRSNNDDLGVLNSLSSLVDLFIYWDIPEYANMYASEAVSVERRMIQKNPMVSAQAYINKGRALHHLGQKDSISFYTEKARMLCELLPYNSGMVDVDLLRGMTLVDEGGDSLESGIQALDRVTAQGTPANQAKAYHHLAQAYLKLGNTAKAEYMLDNMYMILNQNPSSTNILHIDYKPILDHYFKKGDMVKVRQYVEMMLGEQDAFHERSVNYNLVESIVDLQTGSRLQELKIMQLNQSNHRLWMLIIIVLSVISTAVVATLFWYQRKKYVKQIRKADDTLETLVNKLDRVHKEKEMIAQELKEFLTDKDNRQELETLTPYVLRDDGETKFRQHFELLYPLFLPRLRERIPSISRREELLSMLIVLKQDNKSIAELLSIETRSVLMLRHRFRHKIGIAAEVSLDNFIENLLTQ
jgi:tetratricopeptide (TPR) repeat protein